MGKLEQSQILMEGSWGGGHLGQVDNNRCKIVDLTPVPD